MPAVKRVTNEEIVAAYRETGSVWKAAKLLGVAGQSVHERLRAIDYPMAKRHWTPDEIEELRSLVHAGLPASKIADRLGRPFAGVCCKLSELDIKIQRSTANKPRRGAGYDKASIDRHLRALETQGGLKPTSYARSQGLTIEAFVHACERHYPERWRQYVERTSTLPQKTCGYCERTFYPNTARQEHCSRKCASDARTDRTYFGGNRRLTVGLAEGVCQLCGKHGHRGLTPHHVLGKENDPTDTNLVALCMGCHKIVTMTAARKVSDEREFWQSLIELAWLRRHGDDLPDSPMELYVEVILDFDSVDPERES